MQNIPHDVMISKEFAIASLPKLLIIRCKFAIAQYVIRPRFAEPTGLGRTELDWHPIDTVWLYKSVLPFYIIQKKKKYRARTGPEPS